MSANPQSDELHNALFISDLHLGTRACAAKPLLEFLRANPAKVTYLVGDIIDIWRKASFWTEDQLEVVRHLLKRSKTGRVIWVLGNHDEAISRLRLEKVYLDNEGSSDLKICHDYIHETIRGQRCLVTHGHEADPIVIHRPWVAKIAGLGYELLLRMNRYVNGTRLLLGMKPWSLSRYVKDRAKKKFVILDRFRNHWISQASKRECSVVICGHIHTAADIMIRPETSKSVNTTDDSSTTSTVCMGPDLATHTKTGMRYLNTGDWVESHSAVIEKSDGELVLIEEGQVIKTSTVLS